TLFQSDFEQAALYYEKAEKEAYENYGILLNLAAAKEQQEKWQEAEACYLKILECTEDEVERIHVFTALVLHYRKRNMYLKAQRIVNQLIEEIPHQYQGHHLYFLMKQERSHFEEISIHMEEIREEFGGNPQFLIDELAALELAGKEEALLERINNHPAVMEVIPEVALRKKVELYANRKDMEKTTEAIWELLRRTGDVDAAISAIMIEMLNKNHKRAADLANYVMEQEREVRQERFYIAMYLQMNALTLYLDGKKDEKIEELIKKEKEFTDAFFHGQE
ncbi:MAG: hypothetical protein PHN80_14205, partial [Hespellia sp.]|nr:hypothetical protein [Hespellia sp.]